jgi:hypothetical protein
MINLLPCPFCGDIPETEENRYNLRMDGSSTLLSVEIRHHCPRADVKGPQQHYINYKMATEELVIEEWNKRVG